MFGRKQLRKRLRIGVDVGGTNTDAVLLDGAKLLASCKRPTTENISDGVENAIRAVLESSKINARRIAAVMIGTTHFTNALVQRRNLSQTGVLRIGLPAAKAIPPLTDWPSALVEKIGDHGVMVRGAYQYDGSVSADLDEKSVYAAARSFKAKNLRSIAVSAVFAPVNDQMENRAAEILRNELPDASVTLSSRIGRIGLLERENAGILNAALVDVAVGVVEAFKTALANAGIKAPFYISQNDGTLMNADLVGKYPVLTFASGPTNSMRGAAYLSGVEDAIVADIGGTTTDIGVLKGGFPRESSINSDIGGVRTNFRMPDILAIGLGGGSTVVPDGAGVSIGPTSVGYKIASEALVFGGNTLTATDIAVAAGYARVGDPSKIKHLDKSLIKMAVEEIHRLVADGIDRVKTHGDPTPLVLVGGGVVLIGQEIAGVAKTITEKNASVANAIGAAIAQIGGETDKVFSFDDIGRDQALEEAVQDAHRKAVQAGASADTIRTVDIEETPLAYVPGGAVRVRAKVVGDLSI